VPERPVPARTAARAELARWSPIMLEALRSAPRTAATAVLAMAAQVMVERPPQVAAIWEFTDKVAAGPSAVLEGPAEVRREVARAGRPARLPTVLALAAVQRVPILGRAYPLPVQADS
jgi:hypothetical protein